MTHATVDFRITKLVQAAKLELSNLQVLHKIEYAVPAADGPDGQRFERRAAGEHPVREERAERGGREGLHEHVTMRLRAFTISAVMSCIDDIKSYIGTSLSLEAEGDRHGRGACQAASKSKDIIRLEIESRPARRRIARLVRVDGQRPRIDVEGREVIDVMLGELEAAVVADAGSTVELFQMDVPLHNFRLRKDSDQTKIEAELVMANSGTCAPPSGPRCWSLLAWS